MNADTYLTRRLHVHACPCARAHAARFFPNRRRHPSRTLLTTNCLATPESFRCWLLTIASFESFAMKIYSQIATPLKGGEWRTVSMVMVAKALGKALEGGETPQSTHGERTAAAPKRGRRNSAGDEGAQIAKPKSKVARQNS